LVALSRGAISNSYATGNLTGNGIVGGIVGYSIASTSILHNVYYSGKILVSGGSVGSLVGDNNGGIITNGYFNNTINSMGAVGLTHNGGTSNGLGLSSAQMTQAGSFTAFNFTSTPGATGNNWVLVNTDGTLNNAGGATGGTRPMLASEWSTLINSSHQLQLMTMNKTASYTLGSDFSAAARPARPPMCGAARASFQSEPVPRPLPASSMALGTLFPTSILSSRAWRAWACLASSAAAGPSGCPL